MSNPPPTWFENYDQNIHTYQNNPLLYQQQENERLEQEKTRDKRKKSAQPFIKIPLPINPPRIKVDSNPYFDPEILRKFEKNPEKLITYFYPNSQNHSLRPYQVECVEASLKQNCLISLPTGLGKTFIAAVIIYNFLKFYPDHKNCRFLFLAPTKALIDQQVKACSHILEKPEAYIRCVHSGRIKETAIAKELEKIDTAAQARLSSYRGVGDKR